MARVEFVPGWQQRLDQEIHNFMEHLAGEILEDMEKYCPVDTGELKADLGSEVIGKHARIGARSVEHAIFAEEGAGPHMIYPDTKQALYWEGAGHPRASVSHPGYEGSHFMRRALYQRRSG